MIARRAASTLRRALSPLPRIPSGKAGAVEVSWMKEWVESGAARDEAEDDEGAMAEGLEEIVVVHMMSKVCRVLCRLQIL